MSPLKYVGNRSEESLRKFIEENRTPKKKLEDISPDMFGSVNLAINDLKRFFATSAMKDELWFNGAYFYFNYLYIYIM